MNDRPVPDRRLGNVLARCKNHHWAFDVGAIAVGDNFEILVSRKRVALPSTATPPPVETGAVLTLPEDLTYAPSREALEWHRGHVMVG